MTKQIDISPPTQLGHDPLMSVRDLAVEFATDSGIVEAVRRISFDVFRGETLGVVGESGSGKSVTALSILGLLPSPPALISGSISFDNIDLMSLTTSAFRNIRGKRISIVFQDPMISFNPLKTIGAQIAEAIFVHARAVSRRSARSRAIDLLESVGVANPKTRARQFPHEYSGGMLQRAMVAMAVANQPELVLADEPTTALDVTIQAQVLELLHRIQRETGAAMLLITHDIGVIAEMADRVLVMYAGKIVESGDIATILRRPRHPYTQALLRSLPQLERKQGRLLSIPGRAPSLNPPPPGCAFHPRCSLSHGRAVCIQVEPRLASLSDSHSVACHFAEEMEGSVETTDADHSWASFRGH